MTAAVVRRQVPLVRARPVRRAALVTLVLALVAGGVWWATSDRDAGSSGLGHVTADGPVERYTLVYETRHGDGEPIIEQLSVQRPFRSWFASGTSVRFTDAGVLATSSDGDRWLTIEVPITAAGGDLRPLLVLNEAVDLGLVDVLGDRTVRGRACRAYRFGGPVSGGTLTPVGAEPGERAEACFDELGLVLEETWWVDDEIVRTKEAVDLRLGDPAAEPAGVPDDATVLSFDDGGGAVEVIDPERDAGFAEQWRPRSVPAGFDFVDRWAVVPPAIDPSGGSGAPRTTELALITDAWRRGPDLLVVDQGAGRPGVGPPWDEDAPGTEVDLGSLGTGTLVLDLRMSEVRVRRPDDGFVRVAGTLPPDELVAIARTLTPDDPGDES